MKTKKTRIDIRAMLANPIERRRMAIDLIMVAAAIEGIDTTPEQAAKAYDKVQQDKHSMKLSMEQDKALSRMFDN